MLRDVDAFDGQSFSFGAHAPAETTTIVRIDEGPNGLSAIIPDAHLLFTADFARDGADLVLRGQDGHNAIVHDYFATEERAALLSRDGARLAPGLIDALTGPVAPGQYAQAGTPAPAASDAVGRVVSATGDAVIMRNGVAVTLRAGDPVLRADVMQTGSGTLAVTFNDGSTLNLTPNSRIVVSEFVYDPNGQGNSQLLDLVQGSLTFISGEIAHNGNMRIGTPVATMGIRGTVGGVTTASDGTVQFYVSQSATGAVIIDSQGRIVAQVVQDGPMIIVRPVGPLQIVAEELQKTPQQLAIELAALQQIVSIKAVGDQLIQQFFQPQQPNPNPQSTDQPRTQFQIDLQQRAGLFGPDGQPNGGVSPFDQATVNFTPLNPNDTGLPTTVVFDLPGNLPPVNFSPLTATVAEDNTLAFSGPTAVNVYDADTAVLTVTLTVTNGVLSLSTVAGLTFAGGQGASGASMTFSGTQAAINAALQGMTFNPLQDFNGPVTVTITTSDGVSPPLTQTVEVTVTAVNDAPVIAQGSSSALSFVENQSASGVGAGITITDVDSAALTGAKVIISANFHSGQDVLAFTSHGGITGTYDAQTGILTLSGTASLADYQAVLRSVTYSNSSDNPDASPRTISFQVNDGSAQHAYSNAATVTVNVTPVNDGPVLNSFSFSVDQGGSTYLSTADFQITDPDSSAFTFTVSNVTGGHFELMPGNNGFAAFSAFDSEGGGQIVTSFTAADIANGLVRFVHDGGAPPTFSISVSDGSASSPSVAPQIELTNVNEAPEVTASSATVSEEGLNGGLPDPGGDGDTTNSAIATGTIAATDPDGDSLTFSLDVPDTEGLTSNGHAVVWCLSEDGSSLIGRACGADVISVALNSETGAYTVTLHGPIDHPDTCTEDTFTFDIPVSVSDGLATTTSTLSVSIEDDAPHAVDYSVTAAAQTAQNFDVAFVLDFSGSIDNAELNTMLNAVKSAGQSLFEGTTGAVSITLVAFASSAMTLGTFSSFVDFANALNNANPVEDGNRPPIGSGTNFDAALNATRVSFQPSQGSNNNVFFLSDGQSSIGSQTAQNWLNFVTDNDINVTAVGIGNGVDQSGLQAVDVDGSGSPVNVAQFSDLVDELLTLVDQTETHNIFTDNETGAAFGADGGRIASVTIDGYTYYWDGEQISQGESLYSGTSIGIETELGGLLEFHFAASSGHAAGDWSYAVPSLLTGPPTETFGYTLVDSDGDQSTANLTVAITAPSMSWQSPIGGANVAFSITNPDGQYLAEWDSEITSGPGTSFSYTYQDGATDTLRIYGGGSEAALLRYEVKVESASSSGQLNGTYQNDILVAASNSSGLIFDGYGGSDVMFASASTDTFVFAPGYGHDTVVGFNTATDLIDLSGFDFANDIVALNEFVESGVYNGQGLLFTQGQDSLFLQGVDHITLANIPHLV